MYRNPKITKSANGKACANCGSQDGTVVWAHSNEQEHGHGMRIKSHDIYGAYCCMRCHDWYDGRDMSPMDPTEIWARDEKELMFRKAHDRSILSLVMDGVLK